MRWTNNDKLQLTQEKASSKSDNEQLVFNELLKMGFSYSQMGTHYLHDYLVLSLETKVEDFSKMNEFHSFLRKQIANKYRLTSEPCYVQMRISIDTAFANGNIDYLLNAFKGVYDYDKMSISYKPFVMTLRERLLISMMQERISTETQLQDALRNVIDKVSDIRILERVFGLTLSKTEVTA